MKNKNKKQVENIDSSNEKLLLSDVSDSKNYVQELAIKYTSKILGYEKQKYPSDEWDWIEQSFIDGYNKGRLEK